MLAGKTNYALTWNTGCVPPNILALVVLKSFHLSNCWRSTKLIITQSKVKLCNDMASKYTTFTGCYSWPWSVKLPCPLWPHGSPWGPHSVFGSLFLFQGPHCLYRRLKNAWKVHAVPLSNVDNKITCDNTTSTHESHANLSVTSVLFQNNVFPPFKGIISMN